ncbi:DUF2336 domain-containing protein [Rhodobacterales bacterium]|nr:DUF2336 domain-containing protein [Rhodobacterales bacterium]
MSSPLIDLAREETVDARRQLFAEVSDLVMASLDERTDRELAIFSEVVIDLYSLAAPQDRTRLAIGLAFCERTPARLARRLAEDEIAVATPFLAQSPVFTQEDLLDFIERLSNAHLQVIARRSDLSPEVSDRLAEIGSLRVQRILAGNREISLSRPAMLKLVRVAADDEQLRTRLAHRPDLPPGICRALLPMVDPETRRRLRAIIEESLSQEQLDLINRLKALRRDLGPSLENPDIALLWREADRTGITLDELMMLLLQDGRFNHAVELLSTVSRSTYSSLKDAVFNGKRDQVLRIAAKAGLSDMVFSLFAKARCEHLRFPSTQGADWSSAYVKYLEETAATRATRDGDFQARRRTKPGKPRVAPTGL